MFFDIVGKFSKIIYLDDSGMMEPDHSLGFVEKVGAGERLLVGGV